VRVFRLVGLVLCFVLLSVGVLGFDYEASQQFGDVRDGGVTFGVNGGGQSFVANESGEIVGFRFIYGDTGFDSDPLPSFGVWEVLDGDGVSLASMQINTSDMNISTNGWNTFMFQLGNRPVVVNDSNYVFRVNASNGYYMGGRTAGDVYSDGAAQEAGVNDGSSRDLVSDAFYNNNVSEVYFVGVGVVNESAFNVSLVEFNVSVNSGNDNVSCSLFVDDVFNQSETDGDGAL